MFEISPVNLSLFVVFPNVRVDLMCTARVASHAISHGTMRHFILHCLMIWEYLDCFLTKMDTPS